MKISRNFTVFIHFILDCLVPPVLRDSKWFMWLPFKILFGNKANIFFEFKEQAPFMTPDDFTSLYKKTADVHIERESDINNQCLLAIEKNLIGQNILDIACGRGFLSKRLSQKYKVTGADIIVSSELIRTTPKVRFIETQLENLPFSSQQFDTVVCAHTLEHTQDIQSAINELKRVTKKRLIIVLPKQRRYKYTFDLHLHFFPYKADLLSLMKPEKGSYSLSLLGGDWFYIEDFSSTSCNAPDEKTT